MVQLAPVPFDVLVGRMLSELERKRSAFDLPAQRFVKAYPGRDLSIAVHHRRAATPFGPAAGPHTQMAQNIALAWLAGGRAIECKTVQVKDDIEVPRPCIDMETVGYNVEWSQELTVEQSLEEYVKGAMLIEMLKASGVGAGLDETVFDMSVGYDLAGIRSAKVRGFLDGMMDAGKVVERLRAKIPDAYRRFRDLPFPTRISDTLTLSTFHGCPPGEIEAIVEHLVGEVGLDVTVKLNPTLLGRESGRRDPARRAGLSRDQGPRPRLRRGRELGRRGGDGRAPRRLRRGARAQLRREVLQHAGGREPQALLPRQRAADVPVRAAAAPARHCAGRPLPRARSAIASRSRSPAASTRAISPTRWPWA